MKGGSAMEQEILVLAESEIAEVSNQECECAQCTDCNCPDGDCCTDS
ncbi:MAG: hypothetical protein UV75_C0010G0006 [Candidatus Giovannonibacteria bacterium GW2011_GWA1_43_15]|nr:MAG: hypothetical protein UV75_C0010G0006 [Candidatus Giovannonibacteria bacterium GW2011_GWA1_43_15]